MAKVVGRIIKQHDENDGRPIREKAALDQLFPGYHCAECKKYFELKIGMMAGNYVYKRKVKENILMFCSYGCYHKAEEKYGAVKRRLCS